MPSTTRRTTRRSFLAVAGAAAASAAVSGCGSAFGGGLKPTRTIRYQGWAGTVLPSELAEDLGYLGDVKLKWVGNTSSGPQDIQSAATGDVDYGGAFNGAVVKMAAAKAPVTSVISYYGVDRKVFNGFYVLAGSRIRHPRDLIGKKVAMNTLGAHDEAMLDTYLARHGLTRAEAAKVQRIALPPINTEAALRKGQIDVGVLGDIFRDKAEERGGIRALFTDYQLLGTFSAGTYVMADRFLQVNPHTAADFVTGVGRALEWAKHTPREEVVDRMVDIVKRRKRNESTEPLKYWKSFGVAGTAGRIAPHELSTWVSWLERRGDIKPGQVDVRDIYTNKYNHNRSARP